MDSSRVSKSCKRRTDVTLTKPYGSVCLNFQPFAKTGSLLFVESLVCVRSTGTVYKNNSIPPQIRGLRNRNVLRSDQDKCLARCKHKIKKLKHLKQANFAVWKRSSCLQDCQGLQLINSLHSQKSAIILY